MKQFLIRQRWFLWIVPLALIFTLGFRSSDDRYFEISKNLDIFGKMYREVNMNYVDDVDPAKFMREGIDAMLKGLDPYTVYIGASEVEDFRFMSTGQYGGIGAVIGKKDKHIFITEPYEGSPADQAGLRAGDILLTVGGEKIDGKDMETMDVRNLLRGQPKTTVKVTVQREGVANPLSFDILRDEIKIKNVPYYGMADAETGYISLTGFTQGAAGEVRGALEALKRDNAGMKGLVLDLRGNPGGLLFEAIDIANIFVPNGEKIVETRGKIEGSAKVYTAKNQPVDTQLPLVVLVNRGSASASEIVSGVMQDLDRGVIIGQRSFGKGLVQTTRPLSYNAQLKITTAKYYTPSGRCIQAINYAERDEEGAVTRVPDSLRKPFKTAGGRTVYDGGGIEPDVKVDLPTYHTVTSELVRQQMIFAFANKWVAKHPQIAGPREFKITDELYNEFAAFCKAEKFTFETPAEKEWTKFKEVLEKEKYLDDSQTDMDEIKKIISREKEADLITHREEISEFLRSELVLRYYYRKGIIESSFTNDPELKEALRVLKDPARYKALLSAQK